MFKLGIQIGYSKCNSQYHLVFKWSRSSRLIKSSRNWWLDDRTISVNVLVMFYSRSATYREHHPVVRSKVKVMRSTYCMSCMSSAVSRVLTGSDMNVRLGECVNLPQQWWVLEVEQSNANPNECMSSLHSGRATYCFHSLCATIVTPIIRQNDFIPLYSLLSPASDAVNVIINFLLIKKLLMKTHLL